MLNKTTAAWSTWLQDARKLALNQAVDLVAFAEFILAQQERIEELERAVKNAQMQGKVWRELAAERLEQIKQGERKNA
jgi:cytoplasmic iron level regulating protein YaaA (DUF328/UPF0246 family)